MWGLLETLILYCKKKRLTIPLLFLGVGALIYLAISLITTPGLPQSDQTSDPAAFHVRPVERTVVPSSSSSPYPREAVRDHLPEPPSPISSAHSTRFTPEQIEQVESISNGENIVNFTRFHEMLRLSLNERFGEMFSRNLASRIAENLSAGETSMEVLEATIREELGAQASDAKVQEVRAQITEVLGKIAQTK